MFKSLNDIPAGVWAVIGTVIGTIVLKWGDRWLNRSATERDDRKSYREEISELRDELRSTTTECQHRIDLLEEEVTRWRNLYYEEQYKAADFKRQLIEAGLSVA